MVSGMYGEYVIYGSPDKQNSFPIKKFYAQIARFVWFKQFSERENEKERILKSSGIYIPATGWSTCDTYTRYIILETGRSTCDCFETGNWNSKFEQKKTTV